MGIATSSSLIMSNLELFLVSFIVVAVTGLPSPPMDDYPDDILPIDDNVDSTTAKTTKATTTKISTTKATTTATTVTGNRVKFPSLKSPVAGYKYSKVFGVHVFVNSTKVSEAKFQHVCGIVAQTMDNDEDGCVDVPAIIPVLTARKLGVLVKTTDSMWAESFRKTLFNFKAPQDDWETQPTCSGTKGTTKCFDATQEEVFHLITDAYSLAYPKMFGINYNKTSSLTKLLDAARGGKYKTPPKKYPASAYYTYYTGDCGYDCQAVEYLWMGLAAYLDMNKGRPLIKKEYRFINKAEITKGDPNMVKLLTNKQIKLPKVAPNGVYKGKTKCAAGVNLF